MGWNVKYAYYIFGFITVIVILSSIVDLSFIVPLDPKILHYLARIFGVIYF